MSKLVISIFALATTLSLAFSSQAQERVAQRPTVSVGDTWTYQFKNKKSPSRVTRQGCDYSVTVDKITSTSVYSRIAFPDLCEVSITTAYPVVAGSIQKFDLDLNHFHYSNKSYKAFDFPLEVGKTWSDEFEWRLNGWTYKVQLEGRVESIEKVTTPAGTFEAFKISLRHSYFGTSRRGPTQSGVLDDTFWYSPEVKNFVRRIYDDPQWAYVVRELVSYELH